MKEKIAHLRDWSDWGRQWVDYLRKSEIPQELQPQLHMFSEAFVHMGRKAASYKGKMPSDNEITRLTTKAEEIQNAFHRFLKLVQDKSPNDMQPEEEHEAQVNIVQRHGQPVPVQRPVPIGGHKLPPLPYAYNALEPYIDEQTMRLHHDKHHQSYVDGLNKAEIMMAQARTANNFDLIKHWEREAAFHGAGHYLHTIFWQVMSPEGGGEPENELANQINRDFGSFDAFKRHFSQAAEKVEGGGWAILVWAPRAQHLEILTAEKHQNLSQWDVIPLLVLDVWEHAYYLSYQNDRARYIQAWWNVVNWPYAGERFLEARRLRWQPY